jgi:hypothetical protein
MREVLAARFFERAAAFGAPAEYVPSKLETNESHSRKEPGTFLYSTRMV